ncbi:polyprenol monophosphomannose synthase [Geodermatophilus sabuli]|uniref:Polyprenol monophosphomannose synthase n=1 Tax=Geodermatophilus sabuli TaxID=1564158 RepID=A0A7K3VZC6_9ACTN|nr:polyprenol monophosphomannose synthase [Geodermatophilus sabuli]NEK58005.1 polyprenol monophosphomannose synthase [Geodermatophilus sabuli]
MSARPAAPRSPDRRPAPRSLWVVLPTYQEIENVERVVRAVHAVLGGCGVEETAILVVDDSSPDGTAARARELARELPGVHVLVRDEREGLGPAYAAGFAHAVARGADCLLQMDADLSHDPADIPRLVAAVQAGADIAVGSRYVPGGGVSDWGLVRRLLSRGGSLYARTLLGVGVRDLTAGFKCLRAEAVAAIDVPSAQAHGYSFQIEVTYRALRAGLRVVEVPIVFHERSHGRSKMTTRIALEALVLVPRLRFTRPR